MKFQNQFLTKTTRFLKTAQETGFKIHEADEPNLIAAEHFNSDPINFRLILNPSGNVAGSADGPYDEFHKKTRVQWHDTMKVTIFLK